MSIRALALDLYKAKQKVANLEKLLANGSTAEQKNLQQELQIATQEEKMLCKMLAGEKESGDFRKKFQ